MTAPSWLKARYSGSTTNPDKQVVLWEGEHLAVIKEPGHSYYGGSMSGSEYVPQKHLIVRKGMRFYSDRDGAPDTVECFEGRITKAALGKLIGRAMFADPHEPDTRVKLRHEHEEKAEREQAERDAQYAEREREERVTAHADQMLGLLERIAEGGTLESGMWVSKAQAMVKKVRGK